MIELSGRARKKLKLISVLLPSRDRMDLLKQAIQSLIDKADDISRVEVLIRFDQDDLDSITRIMELPFDKVDIYIVVGERFEGYADLNLYIHELCAISRGEFLFLYNDDAMIGTQGWDSIIAQYSGRIIGINPGPKYNIFPIVNRKIIQILGYFSLCAHNDSWMHRMLTQAELELRVPELQVIHNRDEMHDKTFKERTAALERTREKYKETTKIILDEARRLANKVKAIQERMDEKKNPKGK